MVAPSFRAGITTVSSGNLVVSSTIGIMILYLE